MLALGTKDWFCLDEMDIAVILQCKFDSWEHHVKRELELEKLCLILQIKNLTLSLLSTSIRGVGS